MRTFQVGLLSFAALFAAALAAPTASTNTTLAVIETEIAVEHLGLSDDMLAWLIEVEAMSEDDEDGDEAEDDGGEGTATNVTVRAAPTMRVLKPADLTE